MRKQLRLLVAATVALVIASAAWSVFASPATQTVQVDPAAKHRAEMMTRAMAINDSLNALTDQMNKATGQAKIDAMARLLTALVEHRSMMMQGMKMMQDDLDTQHESMKQMRHMMGNRMSNAPPADVKK